MRSVMLSAALLSTSALAQVREFTSEPQKAVMNDWAEQGIICAAYMRTLARLSSEADATDATISQAHTDAAVMQRYAENAFAAAGRDRKQVSVLIAFRERQFQQRPDTPMLIADHRAECEKLAADLRPRP